MVSPAVLLPYVTDKLLEVQEYVRKLPLVAVQLFFAELGARLLWVFTQTTSRNRMAATCWEHAAPPDREWRYLQHKSVHSFQSPISAQSYIYLSKHFWSSVLLKGNYFKMLAFIHLIGFIYLSALCDRNHKSSQLLNYFCIKKVLTHTHTLWFINECNQHMTKINHNTLISTKYFLKVSQRKFSYFVFSEHFLLIF